MKTLFAITHINKQGMRGLTEPNQGRFHFATFDEAQARLDALRDSLTEKILGAEMGATLEVRAVKCYDHGDAIGVWFNA